MHIFYTYHWIKLDSYIYLCNYYMMKNIDYAHHLRKYPSSPFHSIPVLCLVTQWYLVLCNPMDCNPSGSSVHGDSPGKNTGVGYHTLLQGIFPAQGSNPGLLHCRQILYCLSHRYNRVWIFITMDLFF